jgi:hypothetical protein
MSTNERTVTIVATSRLRRSRAGNPRIVLHLEDGGTLQVSDDTSVAYSIESREWEGTPVVVSLTRNGRVWDVRHA